MGENRYIGLDDLEKINRKMSENIKDRKNKKNRVKKERKSIFDRFSTRENIIIFSFLLIFLILAWNLVKSYDPYDLIDYREINSSTLLNNSSREYDRDVYWILNEIVLNILYSSEVGETDIYANGEGLEESLYYKFSTIEYYDALIKDYQKYLSKEKYKEIANKVIKNYKQNYNVEFKVSTQVPIKKVYKVNNLNNGDFYLVELNTSLKSYIGIQLIRETSKFKIFYIE